MEKKETILDNVHFSLVDGVVYADFEEPIYFTLEKSKLLVEERLKFQEGKDYPLFMDMRIISMAKESRDYLKVEGVQGIKAGAFLVSNYFTRFVLNFFLSVSRPEVPARLFTDKEEAVKWLQQFK